MSPDAEGMPTDDQRSTREQSLRYLYANFTDGSCNWGNHIIDHATRRLLAEQFSPPVAEFDSFTDEPPEGDFDFVLVPGCTMITPGQNPGLDHIERLGCPVYCPAGSLWVSLGRPGWLIRARIIGQTPSGKVDLRIARKLTGPIGARDSFTYRTLREAGLETHYTGCPTLTLPADDVCDDGFVLMSLGRRNVRTQTWAGRRLSRRCHLIGLVHEVADYDRYRAAGWNLPLVRFEGDMELYLSYFQRASLVITGRLHGALPALAYRKRVFYYGTRDTRTTILDDLGVPIHAYGELSRALERASGHFNRSLVEKFRENWDRVIRATLGRHLDSAAQAANQERTTRIPHTTLQGG